MFETFCQLINMVSNTEAVSRVEVGVWVEVGVGVEIATRAAEQECVVLYNANMVSSEASKYDSTLQPRNLAT